MFNNKWKERKITVDHGQVGVLIHDDKVLKVLQAGINIIEDPKKNHTMIVLPINSQTKQINVQEITLDNGQVNKVSYNYSITITDPLLLVNKVGIMNSSMLLEKVDEIVRLYSLNSIVKYLMDSKNIDGINTKEAFGDISTIANEELVKLGLSVRLAPILAKFQISTGTVGMIYRNYKLITSLEPGVHEIENPLNDIILFVLPTMIQSKQVVNQEVLTKDGIALRFSYFYFYQITDPLKVVANFDISKMNTGVIAEIEFMIHAYSQIAFRDIISSLNAEELNENKAIVFTDIAGLINEKMKDLGVIVTSAPIRDITFPKSIQDIMAVGLESKIKSKADLELARSSVAVARAMKNAADLLKDDDNMKMVKYMEHMEKLAKSGNVNFYVGMEDKVKLTQQL